MSATIRGLELAACRSRPSEAETRGEDLTFCEAGPLFGASRATIGRHVSLARLAPDILKVVAGLKTTTAS